VVIFCKHNEGGSRRTGGCAFFGLELNSFILDEIHTSQGQVIYPVQFPGIGTSNDSSSSTGKDIYLSLYCTCVDPINMTVFAATTINPVHSAAGYTSMLERTDYLSQH
jgi:hypothetical protein